MTAKQLFAQEAVRQAQEARTQLSAPTVRLERQLSEDPLGTVQQLIARRRLSDGFSFLAQKGRLDMSLEALVTQGRFGSLFSDEEVNWCLSVLLEAGFYKLS